MKQILFIIVLLISFYGQSQNQFLLSLSEHQVADNSGISTTAQLRFPKRTSVLVMGGLNDLDGMGNYFNVYGSKLIVDSMKMDSSGAYNLTLRREDGQHIYNIFPTLNAKLVPLTTEAHQELLE